MIETKNYISTKEMTYEQWQEARCIGLGGSDVSAVLGLSRWKTPLDVYNEKVNGVKVVENAKMRAGKKLEDIIADWWMEETGIKLLRDNKIRIHPEHDFLIANLDRVIVKSNGNGNGIFEAKNTTTYAKKLWGGEISDDAFCQTQHYFDVTKWIWGNLAALVDGWDFNRYHIQPDKEFIEMKNEVLIKFWNHNILSKIPPEPSTEDDLKKYCKSEKGKTIELVGENYKTLEDLKLLKEREKELKKTIDEKALSIKLVMKESTIATYAGKTVATFNQNKPSKKFNENRYELENPDIYDSYCEEKEGARVFLLKI
jgi:putative phage-type endonuclease